MLTSELERFSTDRPGLCHCLRWKGMFIQVEHDPSIPPADDTAFWCLYTQNCIGPDGNLAEPGNCASASSACYGKGRV